MHTSACWCHCWYKLTLLTCSSCHCISQGASSVSRCSNIGSTPVPVCACSFRGDLAARPRWAGRTLSWALDMANFENVPVQLTGFEMENSTMLWSVFMSEVGQNIKVCHHSFVPQTNTCLLLTWTPLTSPGLLI